MAAKLIKRFKSQISWATSVNVLQGDYGYFFTLSKTKKNKESGKYEDVPFFEAKDLAAIVMSSQQAIHFIDANPLPKDGATQGTMQQSAELPKSVSDDEIQF